MVNISHIRFHGTGIFTYIKYSWFIFVSFQSLASVTHGHGKHHAGHRPELGKGSTQDEAEQLFKLCLVNVDPPRPCESRCRPLWGTRLPPLHKHLVHMSECKDIYLAFIHPDERAAPAGDTVNRTLPIAKVSSAVPVFQVSIINFTATPVSSLTLVPRGTGVFVGEPVTGNPISPTQTNKSYMRLIGGWTIQFEKNKISQIGSFPQVRGTYTLRCHRLASRSPWSCWTRWWTRTWTERRRHPGWEAGDVQQKSSPGHRICRGNPGFLGHGSWQSSVLLEVIVTC